MRYTFFLYYLLFITQLCISQDYVFYLLEWNLIHELKKHIEKNPAVVQSTNNQNQTILHVAACKKKYTLLHYLMEKSERITCDHQGETILHYLCRINTPEDLMALIIKKYASQINIKNKLKRTALWYACQKNNFHHTALLIKYGANPNIQDHEGYTPLFFARNQITIKLLLDAGATPNHKNVFKQKPFESFDYYDMAPHCIFYLLSKNYTLSKKHHYKFFFNKYTYTTFLSACATNNTKLIQTILATKTITFEETITGLLWAHMHKTMYHAQMIYNNFVTSTILLKPHLTLQHLFTNLLNSKYYQETFCLLVCASPQEKSALLSHLLTKVLIYDDTLAEHLLYNETLTSLLSHSIFTQQDYHALLTTLKTTQDFLENKNSIHNNLTSKKMLTPWIKKMLQKESFHKKLYTLRAHKKYTDCLCITADIYQVPQPAKLKKNLCCIS